MLSQEIQFFISIKSGIVEQIGKIYIRHPEVKFSGERTKWYEENRRQEHEKSR